MQDFIKIEIENIIKNALTKVLDDYPKKDTGAKPFHHRLIGKDKIAIFSFIHSINTVMGTSIFEPTLLL